MSQRMQVAPKAGKDKKMDDPLEPPGRSAALLISSFCSLLRPLSDF